MLSPWTTSTDLALADLPVSSTPVPLHHAERLATLESAIAGYLVRFKPGTRSAYQSDLASWFTWCDQIGADPRTAGIHHADAYTRALSEFGDPRTGRPAAPSTVARRLSAIHGFYTYCVRQRFVAESPFTGSPRPHVSEESMTTGLNRDELRRLLDASTTDGPRSAALIHLLVFTGLRISEAVSISFEDYGHDNGHRIVRITRKGGKRAKVPLTPPVVRALDAYAGERTTGRVFITNSGRPWDRTAVWRTLRRLTCDAGLLAANEISPHSLRHSFATAALDANVPLRDVQDAMGHADPRTTRRYDRTRHSLDRHAAYAVSTFLADA